MPELLVQSENHCAITAATNVQKLLQGFGIPSALYGADGTCLQPPLLNTEELQAFCREWDCCQYQVLQSAQQVSDHEPSLQTTCPEGHLCLTVPIWQRRQLLAVLFCCLKSLRYQKTESLERVCGRLNVDTAFIVQQGLNDAVNIGLLGDALKSILQVLIEKTQADMENHLELEALSNSLSQSYEELALLHRISDCMKVTQKPRIFFYDLCQDLKEVVEAETLLVLWSDVDSPEGTIRTVSSQPGPDLDPADLELLWHRTQWEAERSLGILIDSNIDRPYTHQWPNSIRNLVSVPIRRDAKNMGALVALNKINKPDFDSIDTKLLISVANEIAVYLQNFRLYQDLQELLIGSLRALTSSIDAKDPYTCGHSERVALISRWLAEQLSLTAQQIHSIYLAGLLHDIGKIGVRESVLKKAGRLVGEEIEQIRKHPQIGANILKPIKQMVEVSQAVLTHHERFDGSGYPQGLSGRSIPLAGRIVMLADSFDAMISDRTYRKALPLPTAQGEIRRFSGTQFDPQLADVFLNGPIPQLLSQLEAVKTDQHGLAASHEPANSNGAVHLNSNQNNLASA